MILKGGGWNLKPSRLETKGRGISVELHVFPKKMKMKMK